MLSFYTDAQLSRPITAISPKLFFCPEEGGTRTTKIYLGNGFSGLLTEPASAGAAVLFLSQTEEFLDGGGTALVPGQVAPISYTGKTGTSITGVTGLTVALDIGSAIRPDLSYTVSGNLVIYVAGSDAVGPDSQVAVCLKGSAQPDYGFRGTPLILQQSSISTGQPLEIDISVTTDPGSEFPFTNIELLWSGFVTRDASVVTALTGSEPTGVVSASLTVNRTNLGLRLFERMLPVGRQVSSQLPGFVVGKSRWRDSENINAVPIIPTNWNVETSTISDDSFVSGVANIGYIDDLAPLQIEETENSLYLRIKKGFYFQGRIRSYLPAGAFLETFAIRGNNQVLTLKNAIAPQTPIYVGHWFATENGTFIPGTQYRYSGKNFDTSNADNQFTVNRRAGTITLRGQIEPQNVFLGFVSGDAIDYFDVPIFPVASLQKVYVAPGLNRPNIYSPNFTYNPSDGTLKVPAIAGSVIGQPVFALCTPGIAVLYEQTALWLPRTPYRAGTVIKFNEFLYRAQNDGISGNVMPAFTLTVDSVINDVGLHWVCEGPEDTVRALADLNPAFAGIAQGYLYLSQAYRGAYQIALSCDKPRISIPPSFAGQVGLIGFGPVYYNGDYALLIATVTDSNGTPVPNVQLEFVPGTDFEGQINYQTPTAAAPIIVRTGGDGVANLIYTPQPDFGYYLPTSTLSQTTIAGDTVNLTIPIEFGQLWNATDGWLCDLYQVLADNPYYGILNADVSAGQIPFTTTGPSGTPGSPDYVPFRTNGRRVPFLTSSGSALAPIQALTANGTVCSQPTDLVAKLVYPVSVASTENAQAYFISYIQRVTMRLAEMNSNVVSNSVLLQMAPPPLIGDTTPYLILDSLTEGQLDVQRLAFHGANLYFQSTNLL